MSKQDSFACDDKVLKNQEGEVSGNAPATVSLLSNLTACQIHASPPTTAMLL